MIGALHTVTVIHLGAGKFQTRLRLGAGLVGAPRQLLGHRSQKRYFTPVSDIHTDCHSTVNYDSIAYKVFQLHQLNIQIHYTLSFSLHQCRGMSPPSQTILKRCKKSDEIASIYGPYLTVKEIRKLTKGAKLEVLCIDGLNYYVEVKEMNHSQMTIHLHFLKWSTKYDYKGPYSLIYVANRGTYSEGITSQNSYAPILFDQQYIGDSKSAVEDTVDAHSPVISSKNGDSSNKSNKRKVVTENDSTSSSCSSSKASTSSGGNGTSPITDKSNAKYNSSIDLTDLDDSSDTFSVGKKSKLNYDQLTTFLKESNHSTAASMELIQALLSEHRDDPFNLNQIVLLLKVKACIDQALATSYQSLMDRQ